MLKCDSAGSQVNLKGFFWESIVVCGVHYILIDSVFRIFCCPVVIVLFFDVWSFPLTGSNKSPGTHDQ